ncbi:MAG: hypothetical protein IT353_24280 [Gemmatimonadaceae bacterium]|nr:hypothetical protein [Gemmatimonadaceae bacterium]
MSRFSFALRAAAVLSLSASAAHAQAGSQPPARLPATTVVGEAGKTLTVQNDRQTPVTLYLDAGRVDRAIGTVAAGAIGSVTIPEWSLRGQRTVKVVARVDRDAKAIASYVVPVSDDRTFGLLVPPASGLPSGDSIVVSLPTNSANAATVTVDNKRAGAVTVFAEQGLMFVRLGEVAAHQQETLRVPESLTKSKAAIRVFARPEGAATVSTKGVRVEQGDHIAVIVM